MTACDDCPRLDPDGMPAGWTPRPRCCLERFYLSKPVLSFGPTVRPEPNPGLANRAVRRRMKAADRKAARRTDP